MDDGTRNTILKISALAAAIGPLIIIFGSLINVIGKSLTAFSNLGKGILVFINQAKLGVGAGGAMVKMFTALTGPIGLVVAAIGVLAAAFASLWNTNEDFSCRSCPRR